MIPTMEVVPDVRADDVIVVRYAGSVDPDKAEKLMSELSALWGCKVVVMGDAPSLTVIKSPR